MFELIELIGSILSAADIADKGWNAHITRKEKQPQQEIAIQSTQEVPVIPEELQTLETLLAIITDE